MNETLRQTLEDLHTLATRVEAVLKKRGDRLPALSGRAGAGDRRQDVGGAGPAGGQAGGRAAQRREGTSTMMNDQQQPQATAAPASTWCGWARNGTRGKWRYLVRGAASDTETMELLRQRTSGRRHVDLTVMREGRHPDEQKPQ